MKLGRRRYVVEREVALNRAEIYALQRLVRRSRNEIDTNTAGEAALPLLERIENKLTNATRNWSAA